MNGHEHDPLDPASEAWREFDDTLADGPSPADVPDEAKVWLGRQRFVHGLLRGLHTADAAAREGRIASILERIDRDRVETPRRWWVVAAAALVFATLGVWFALPAKLPTAEAAVGRAVEELSRHVDRRFRVDITSSQAKGVRRIHLLLVTRPGGCFRVDGKLSFGDNELGNYRIGCDGEELWIWPSIGSPRAVPVAKRDLLMRVFGDVLDLGYLDLHDLVRKLPADFELAVTGREADANGRPLLRVEARLRDGQVREAQGNRRLRSAWLLCDEASGMVTRLEADVDVGRTGFSKLVLEYLGEESPELVDYKRPW
jgi:hypothetical protein